jgi:hypothetical protein
VFLAGTTQHGSGSERGSVTRSIARKIRVTGVGHLNPRLVAPRDDDLIACARNRAAEHV